MAVRYINLFFTF